MAPARRSGDESFTKIVLAGLLLAAAIQVLPGIIAPGSSDDLQLTLKSGVITDSSRDALTTTLPVQILGPVDGQLPWISLTFPDTALRH